MEPLTYSFELAKIHLRNIRGFSTLHLDLQNGDKPRKRTLIIGKNGTCKSSLLRAIAIGISDRVDATSLLSEKNGPFVSENSKNGSITLTLSENSQGTINIHKRILRSGKGKDSIGEKGGTLWSATKSNRPDLSDDKAPNLVCAYGSGRFGTGPDSGRSYRIADSVATLFRYNQTLIDPELTLRRLQGAFGSDIYDRTLHGIRRALGLSEEDYFELPQSGGILISGPTVGKKIPLEGWADGYRLTFSWILDLYAWALKAASIDEEGHIEGILLIDEIDQHLHPSMQAEILPRLSELLPKMQIFATTHSPLVALDAKPEELIVLRREGDHVVSEQNMLDFSGYSAEDMLSDPRLFDTEQVYGQETQEKLAKYKELASIPKDERTPEQRNELRRLAMEINSMESLAERENETTQLLKDLVAKHGL
jgi:PAS domain-containing protein